ncbi:hypothetical protein [Aquibacillus saliphilus]|uniref:hypothetical protein n=1 Tax=Aquibacillus saliphilus TaxID=1909422 RepID=UPI001CEFE442|nr:hypothetical protein [Aquibacillus saliphilus]
MNANGMARGYMAKNMNEERFLSHVTDCVRRKLIESNFNPEIIVNWETQSGCLIVFHVSSKIFSLKLTRDQVSNLKNNGPYLLDRMIWNQLIERGINIEQDHYLTNVFM